MSIVWIWVACNLIIDMIEIFGVLSGVPSTLLGVTLLAWGNSVGDFIANISISEKGFGEMALTGCFAGPLFDFMFGMGISTLMANLNNGAPLHFQYKDSEMSIPFILLCY